MKNENKQEIVTDSKEQITELNSSDIGTSNKTKKDKAIFITKICANVIFYLIVLWLLIFSISNITAKDNEVKSIFGIGYESVKSDSMMPKNKDDIRKSSFNKGDLIFVDKLSNKEKQKLKIDQIITFYDPSLSTADKLNSHRICAINYDEDGKLASVITIGDKAASLMGYDNVPHTIDEYLAIDSMVRAMNFQEVQLTDIKAKYTSTWEGAGKTLDWCSNPSSGFIVVVILPVLAFLGFEVFMVIRNVLKIKQEKMSANAALDKEQMKKDLEAEKERMRQEILEQLKKEQEEKEKNNKK